LANVDGRVTTRPVTWTRRVWAAAQWVAPGVVLALMPKCPACLAAYVALATGLGISFTAAAWLRWLLMVLCIVSLSYLVIRRLARLKVRPATILGFRRMAEAADSINSHALAIFYLCALAGLAAWAVLYRQQIDRRKYTLQAILALVGVIAVALAVGTRLLGR